MRTWWLGGEREEETGPRLIIEVEGEGLVVIDQETEGGEDLG